MWCEERMKKKKCVEGIVKGWAEKQEKEQPLIAS
jgi:hypothetical protein